MKYKSRNFKWPLTPEGTWVALCLFVLLAGTVLRFAGCSGIPDQPGKPVGATSCPDSLSGLGDREGYGLLGGSARTQVGQTYALRQTALARLRSEPTCRPTLASVLDAIAAVETGGNPKAVGDNGQSRGAYQISEAYWADSGYSLPYLPNVYNPAMCREVIMRYWKRYAPDAVATGNTFILAAVHNSGPRAAKGRIPASTKDYANRVKALVE